MAKYLDKLSLLIALTAGTFAFLIVCGPSILNPLNESWLLGGGDLTQQYFGWAFFRHSPWTLPLGLNPMYGMDISSSIVYSDGNPLISVTNFAPVPRYNYRLPLPMAGAWQEVFNSDDLAFGGSGVGNHDGVAGVGQPHFGQPASAEIVLPPLATIWLTPAK